jgi:hypothetical protein
MSVSFGGKSLFPPNKLQPVDQKKADESPVSQAPKGPNLGQMGNPTGVKNLSEQAFGGSISGIVNVKPTESCMADAMKSLIIKMGTQGSEMSGEIPLGLDFESAEFKTSDFWKLMFGKAPAGTPVPEITPSFVQNASNYLKKMSLAP